MLWHVDFLWLQVVLLAAALFAAWTFRDSSIWNARPPQWCAPLRRSSRNGFLGCLLPALLSVALRLALLPWIPVPHPVVPDEYSHLLMAKTFLLGRLTNPPHPLWQHFETIHVLSQPTYSSMYMAGQACFLALGKILTGSFFGGVLLSTALACAAITWFLRLLVPPRWALFGGCLAAVRFGAASYWNDSYWGGSVGALGGALALGGFVRLTRRVDLGSTIAFAVGTVLLANSRPYEGFGLVATLLIALAWRVIRNDAQIPWKRIVWSAAVALVLFGVAGFLMTHQWKAVTGQALTPPYVVNERLYGWPLTLPFTPIRQVSYRHRELALYHDWELDEHAGITDVSKIPWALVVKTSFWWLFFFGAALSPALLFAHRILKTRQLRVIWAAGAVVGLQVLTEQSGYPHYLSPATPIIVLFIVRGFEYLSHARPKGIPLGPAVVRFAVPMMLAVIAVRAAVLSPSHPPPAETMFFSWCCTDNRSRDREPLVEKLTAEPGKHLVLVSYDLKKYDTFEWVYNEPDIDHSKIVFARDMGPEKNQELLNYFSGRRVWRVRIASDRSYSLSDYGAAPIQAASSR